MHSHLNPRFSVITVTYNAEKVLEDTIQSVISQTYHHVEYIIVDGASKDGTMAIVNRYRDRISQVVSEPDKGLYDAMNKGIALATGDYLCFLNAGDSFHEDDTLQKMVHSINANELPDVLYGQTALVDTERHFLRMRRLSGRGDDNAEPQEITSRTVPHHDPILWFTEYPCISCLVCGKKSLHQISHSFRRSFLNDMYRAEAMHIHRFGIDKVYFCIPRYVIKQPRCRIYIHRCTDNHKDIGFFYPIDSCLYLRDRLTKPNYKRTKLRTVSGKITHLYFKLLRPQLFNVVGVIRIPA